MKKILVISVAILLVVIVVLMFVFLNGTNKGKIVVGNSLNNSKVENDESAKKYDDGYIVFDYPAKYLVSKVGTIDGRVLTNALLQDGSVGGGKIAVNLTRLTQNLDDIPSVQMRRLKKDQYTEEVGNMGDYRGLLFRTTDKKERVLFINNKDTILTVAMTVLSDDFATTEKEWQEFLRTVRFH